MFMFCNTWKKGYLTLIHFLTYFHVQNSLKHGRKQIHFFTEVMNLLMMCPEETAGPS